MTWFTLDFKKSRYDIIYLKLSKYVGVKSVFQLSSELDFPSSD